ncbi:MAG: methyltransferase domain-containing protein [Halobacteriota archaeon]
MKPIHERRHLLHLLWHDHGRTTRHRVGSGTLRCQGVRCESFTVWRCAQCGSLHALEPIDADRYYRHYPVKRQRYNFLFKALLRKRMEILKRTGLQRGDTLLDYGCGSGNFVRYAQEHGVQAEGCDPYSEEFGDASLLNRTCDFVTAQGVLEQ